MSWTLLQHSILFFCWFVGWLIFWRLRFISESKSNDLPKVSLIVPARNEEKNLPKLLSALKEQTYKNLQIIVVNDNSTDATKQVVMRFDGIVLVDLKEEPPPGWVGKSWACWNGYLKSDGEIIVFMDADVEPARNAVETLVALLMKDGGLVSVWPNQRLEKFYEHLTLPFNMIVVGSMGSFSAFNLKPMGAYGPVVVVKRKDYEETKGHSAFKNGVLEDIKLGRLFIEKGYAVNNYLGGRIIKFRMYPNGFKEMFEGFTKNMSLGAASAGLNFFLVFSWLVGVYSSIFNLLSPSFFIYYFLFVLQIHIVSRKTGDYNFLDALLYPMHFSFFLIVFFTSLIKVIFFKTVVWKGRKIRV
ncbi:MAG: glycosyltransferase family 2 protein [Pseudothermotoga sp.]|nr:glycosyltransferase family 2 protein [Pseudothermotoga sp.]MCX7813558.1 glycosyltransferase family 2 protein [Pseudothermotoga sp.]MDW8140038.1 glycosyltransferase family 2 protein [Pseudothermotoga sp.]